MGSLSRRSRPAVNFNPSFAPLEEDPNGRRLEGWIVDEEEYSSLDRRLEEEGKVILVVGNPSPSSLKLLQSVLSTSSLLLLPPPQAGTSTSLASPPSSSSPSSSTSRKSIVHLQASLANQGIGKVFEEALTVAGRWRKGKAKDSKRNIVGSKERRRSAFGLSDQTEGAVGGEFGSIRNRLSRPISLMSFSSDNSLFSSANAARSPPPAPAPSSSNSRPIDVVLNFLPTTFPSDPTSLQALLSSTFLVTTVSLPVLSPKVANLNHASSPSPSRHRPSSNLAPSSPPSSLRRVSANHLSVPMGLSASTPSSPTTRPLDLTRSRPSSIFSNSDSNPFSLSSEAILAHILPDNSPPLLPMLLDKFMKSTLANFPSVGMIVLPESILASRPSVFDHDPLDPEDEDEEQEELEGLSSEGSSSSHASSSSARNRFPAQNGRSLDASPSRLPTPPIISLLLTSSLRPPLLLPPSLKPSSRRGSSSSSSSMTFRSSTLNPSTPPPSSLQLLAPPAEISTIRTFIPSPESITFIPRPLPRPAQIPLSSSWGSGGDKLLNSLALTTDGLPSTRRHEAHGFEVPQLEKSSSSSGSDGGGIRTPGGGSSVRSDATAEDASVAGSPKGRGGATLKNTKFGDLGRGGKSSGAGGESWISRFFGSMGRKGKARVIT